MHDFAEMVHRQRSYFLSQATKPYEFRMEKLRALAGWIDANESAVLDALARDLGKCAFEGYLTEVGMVRQELKDAMRHLARWMRPQGRLTPLAQFPGKSFTLAEPRGVVLILSPWNYPFLLSLEPLVGALAAGFFGVWLVLGGLLWLLTGVGPLAGLALSWEGSLRQLAGKLRTQFASYDYSWARLDRGIPLRDKIIDSVMHPLLQSYALGLLLLALWGTLIKVKQAGRRELLPYALLLAGAGAAAVTAADPIANGWVLPLLAIWGAAPAGKLAEWTLLMAAPEGGKGRKKAPPLPMPLWVVKLVVSVAVYAIMLALVLIFFTGNGVFIYEAF